MIARAATLACPLCGARGLFQNWLKLRPACPRCGLRLDRGEPDHWLGAYTVNLIIAEGLAAALLAAVLIATIPDVPWSFLLWGGIAAMLLAPFLFYPFSRTLWLAGDLIFRPPAPRDFAALDRGLRATDIQE